MRETIGFFLEKVRARIPGFGDHEIEARTTTTFPVADGALSLPEFLLAARDVVEPAPKRRKIGK